MLYHFPTATIIRPSFIFGPEDRFLNNFAGTSSVLNILPLIENGRARLQPVHVADVANAILHSVQNPAETAGLCFDLGGHEVLRLREISDLVFEILQQKPHWIPR